MKIKNKMVIVHIILSKGFVGSEKYVLDLVKYQKTKNNVFAIISKKNQTLNRLLKKEIKTFEISDFFKKFFINSLIKKINPDIVHTHLGDAIKNIQKPTVIFIHILNILGMMNLMHGMCIKYLFQEAQFRHIN